MEPAADADTIAFAEKVLALLRQGSFTATYKFAVLIGLIDLSLEGYTSAGLPPDSVTTAQLADAVTRLYWPQVAPFQAADGAVLRQSSGGQAKIVTLVAAARARLVPSGGSASSATSNGSWSRCRCRACRRSAACRTASSTRSRGRKASRAASSMTPRGFTTRSGSARTSPRT
jgi:hypothetical protein